MYFFGDTAGVFDQLDFHSIQEAEYALRRNGFARYEDDENVQEFIAKPKPPFRRQPQSKWPDLLIRQVLALIANR